MTDDRTIGTYRLADISVRVESLYAKVHELCQDYRCADELELCQDYRCADELELCQSDCSDDGSELVVRTSQAAIDFERERSEAADVAAGRTPRDFSDDYLETLAVYRKIAEALPARGSVLVHGSCVAVDGMAYLFCAPSGTGKSTHARLWRELLGERATMVNDDKPLVHVADVGVLVYGTPWNGKHRLSANIAVPLKALCLLARGAENRITRISAAEAYPALMKQVYRPADPIALAKTLDLVDCLLGNVALWRLECNTGIEAAQVSFAAMSGK